MTELQELLNINYLSGLTLMTDPSTLTDQEVTMIDITETPDVEQYVSPGSFLLTTAMSFKDRQSELKEFIASLIRAQAVGLGIKTGRFLQSHLDDEVIHYANQQRFPLVNIPDKYPLGPLLHQLSQYLWSQKHEEIEFAIGIQNQLSDLLRKDLSIKSALQEIGRLMNCPIILLDPFKDVIVATQEFRHKEDWLHHIVDQLKTTFKGKILPNDYVTISNNDGSPLQISISKVQVFNHFPHYFILLRPERIIYPISSFTIDQAELVLSSLIFREDQLQSAYYNALTAFYVERLNLNPNDFTQSARTYKNDLIADSNYYLAIAIHESSAFSPLGQGISLQEKNILITHWLFSHINDFFPQAVIIQLEREANPFLILQHKVKHLEKSLLDLKIQLKDQLPLDVIFSIGEQVNQIDDIHHSVTQANLAFKSRQSQQNTEDIVYYNTSNSMQLFQNLNPEDVRKFCVSVLKDLAYPDDENLEDLRTTLKVYLNNQCEATATAKEMYIHRNTVTYRIERCQDILKVPIQDPQASLDIRLALSLSD